MLIIIPAKKWTKAAHTLAAAPALKQ